MIAAQSITDAIRSLPDRFVPRFEVFFAKTPERVEFPPAESTAVVELEEGLRREKERLERALYVASDDPAAPPPFIGQLLPLQGRWGEQGGQATNDVLSVEFTESVDKKQPLTKVRVELHNVLDAQTGLFRYTDIPRDVQAGRRGVFPLLEYGDVIALRFGYGAALDWVFEGVVTTLEASFPADGEPKLTVTAVDKRERLRNRKKLKPSRYSAPNEEQIAAKVAAELGLRVAATAAQIAKPTPPAKAKGRPSDQDSLQYLTDRASRAELELTCFGNLLGVLKPADVAVEALGYRYRQGLTSFSPTLNNAGQPSAVRVVSRNTVTGKKIDVTVKPADLQRLGLSPPGETESDQVAKKGGERVEVVTDVNASTPEEARQIAIGILKRNLDGAITAGGDVVGDPRVRVRRTLWITGVGRFSGAYYVTETTHRFGSNGYQTSFKARRNLALGPPDPPAVTGLPVTPLLPGGQAA